MRPIRAPNRTGPIRPYFVEQIDDAGHRIALRMISADQPGTAIMHAAQKHFRAYTPTPQEIADHCVHGTVELAFGETTHEMRENG